MSLFDRLLDVVVPHECLTCGSEGSLLCPDCLRQLPAVPERCYRCRRESAGWATCTDCRPFSHLVSVCPATVYAGAAKQLIWKLKSSGAQAAAEIMAGRMKPLITGKGLIVSIPTATTRVRQRGYDQARLLGRQLARQSHLPWLDCLARSGQAHQVGAGREQRLSQLKQAYRVSQQRFVQGARIILVDDVVTTGATLEAAAAILQAAGAARIEAVTFAQPIIKNSSP